jgi:hypothetical protein
MIHYFNILKDEFDSFKCKDSIVLNTPFDRSISKGDYVVFREVVDGVITRSHPIKTLVKSVIIEKRFLFYSKTWIIELEKCEDESDVIQTLEDINELKLESGLHFLIENKYDKEIFEVIVQYIEGDFIRYFRTYTKHSMLYPSSTQWKRIDDFKKELSEYNIVHIIK